MKKIHQLLPNIAFFTSIGLIYFGVVAWANLLACILIALFVYFDDIDVKSAFKYAYKNFGSMLLFIPLGYFQPGVISIGIFSFSLGWIIAYLRLTNFRLVVPGLYFGLILFSISGFYLPNLLSQLKTHTEMNEVAPNFKIKKYGTDDFISKSNVNGKVVIINFWSTWCGTCVKEMLPLNKVYEKYKNHSEVEFLAVNTVNWSKDELSQIEGFIQRKNISLPIYIDESNEMTEAYDILSIPTLFIIDKKGNLRVRHIGFPVGEDLEKYLEEQIEALL